jgi:hypothetical protein
MTQDPPKDKTKALYDELGIPMPNAQETQGKVDPAPSEEKPSSDKKQALYDALGISSNVGAPRIKPPVEQPFTEAPAQGPQTPQQKFEQAIPAGPSMPSATQQEPLSGTLTDSRGPSVVDTPKANYELPPETADISKAKPYGEAFSKQEVATAGPGRSEKAEEDRLFLDRFADLDLKGIEKYKDEVLPRQMNVLKQAQAGYNADDKQVGFSEVDLLGLKQQAERDPSLIPEYEQRVKEHNGMVSSLNKQKMAILDLVGAYERDEKLLSMQELLLKREKGSWGGAVWNSILQGEGDVLSGMAGAAANKLLGLESDKNSVLGSLIFPKGFMAKHLGYEPGTTPDEIAKDFRENTLSEMRGVPKEKLGSEGTTDEYIANKSEGFWGGAFLGLARSAPAMATPAMSGIGFQVFDGTMEEMSGPGFEGVSEEEKMDVAVPISLISVALEKFGFRNLSKSTPVVGEIYKRVLAKVPANATATQIENAVNGEVSGWVSNSLGKLAGGAASEFETGFFQEGATMAAKDLYDITAAEDGKGFQLGNSWRDYAKNMFYSGAQEAAGGMMMATPYAVSAAIKKNEVGKITSDTQYELVEELATDPNFRTTFEAQQAKDVEEGRITPEQSEEIKTDFATARKIVEKIPDDLPVTSKREAFDILSQIDKLSKKDADLVGDKVQALRERLKGLQGVPKVEEAKTDAEGKKVEVKPTEPTGNETKERSTLAETKEDGELHNIPKGGEVQNNAADIQGQSSVSDTKDVTPTERGANKSGLTNEVLQSPVSDQAATDPSTEASSEVQPQEQPATPEYAEYYVKPKLTLDVADDPVALASAYMEEHTGASDESTLDDHIGSYISNNVDYQSFVDFDDVSNVTKDMERAWLRTEGGKPLDVLAQEISANFGGTVTEQDIVDYIKANPFGKRNVTERAKEFANRYEGITGRKMNSLVAKKILGDNVSKRGKNKGNKIKAKGTEWTKAEQEIVDYAASQNVELGEVLDKDIEEADNLTEEDFELIFGGGRLKTISQKTKERNERAREEEKQVQRGAEAQDAGDLRGGKSEGTDTRKGEGEEGKSLADRVRGLKIDKNVAASFIIPGGPAVWNTAVEIVATSLDAGQSIAKAIKAGIDHIRNTDWYKGLTKEQQAASETEFEAPLKQLATPEDKKPKTSQKTRKVVDKSTGVTKPVNKVTVNETTALKNQIRLEIKAAISGFKSGQIAGEIHGRKTERISASKESDKVQKEREKDKIKADKESQKRTDQGYRFGVAEGKIAGEIHGRKTERREVTSDIRNAQKDLSMSVGIMLDRLSGKVSPRQASAIGKAVARINPLNGFAVAKLLDHIDRVIENANYSQSLSEAKSARRKAAKIAANKKVPKNHRDAMLAASKIDVSLIDDPQAYADKVNDYATAMASVKTSRYNQSNTNEFMEFLEPLEKEVDDAYRDIIKEEYGVFDIGELNPKEFLKALEAENIDTAMSELDSKEKRDELTRRIREMADSRASALSSYSNEDMSERQSGIADSLKKANIDRLSLQQQADYIKFADNILVNDAFYGADYMGAIADNSVQIEDALEISAKMPVRNIFSRRLALQGMSQDDMFSFFWSKDVRSAKIQNRIGYGDYIRGKQKWTQQMNEVGQKMTKFYRALSKKYKDSYGEESMTAEGMVAFAIQSMPGLNEEGSFEARKGILEEDIKAKSNDKKLQKEAIAAGIVFNDLIAESKSIEDLLEKTKKKYPAAYESINFLIDLSKPYKDAIKDNAENTWNQPGNYDDPHYIHTRFKERPGAVVPLDPAAPKSVSSTSLRPKMAKSTLSRQKYHTLAPNRIISYDARHNVFGSISNSLYDVYTSRAQMRMSEFFKMPDAVSVFGSPENISFVNEMVKRFVAAQYLKEDEASKLLTEVVKSTRKIATTMALGGFTQIAKQGVEAMMQTTTLLNGRLDKIIKMGPNIGAASELMGKYSIGSRSGIQGGTKWDGKVKQHTAALEAAIRNGAWDHVKQISEAASRGLLYSLTKGDTSVAAMSFMALYEKQRKKQGHRVRDWNTEGELHDGDQQRIDAATWANSMINQFMTSSDSAQMASIAKSGGSGFEKVFKIAAFPFSSFSIQSASKKAVDVSTMYAWTKLALQGDSKRNELAVGKAAQSFLAGALSSAAYAMTAVYMVGALKDYLAELLGSFFDDDDEGDKDFVTMASVIQGIYMLGFMDTDINAIVQKEQRTRVKAAKAGVSSDEIRAQRKETQPEFDKKKVLSRYITDVSGSSAVPLLSDAGIDFLNYLKYKSLVKEGSESVMKKDGTPMKFTAWQRTTQTPFYRYGQGWNDDNPSGLYGVITQNAKRTAEQIELLQKVTSTDE